jgi:hypothetical protein
MAHLDIDQSFFDWMDRLNDYVDGKLSPKEQSEVKAELESDPQKQRNYEQIMSLREDFAKAKVEVQSGIVDSKQATADEESYKRFLPIAERAVKRYHFYKNMMRAAWVLLALLFIGVGGYLYWASTLPSEQSTANTERTRIAQNQDPVPVEPDPPIIEPIEEEEQQEPSSEEELPEPKRRKLSPAPKITKETEVKEPNLVESEAPTEVPEIVQPKGKKKKKPVAVGSRLSPIMVRPGKSGYYRFGGDYLIEVFGRYKKEDILFIKYEDGDFYFRMPNGRFCHAAVTGSRKKPLKYIYNPFKIKKLKAYVEENTNN